MLKTYCAVNFEEFEAGIKKDFPNVPLEVSTEFKIYEHLVPKLKSKEEICSIRYRPGKIRIYAGHDGQLSVYATKPDDDSYNQYIGIIRIPYVIIADLTDFPEGAATLDEYESKSEMIKDLESIYDTKLTRDDYLTGNFISDVLLD